MGMWLKYFLGLSGMQRNANDIGSGNRGGVRSGDLGGYSTEQLICCETLCSEM